MITPRDFDKLTKKEELQLQEYIRNILRKVRHRQVIEQYKAELKIESEVENEFPDSRTK